MKRKFKAIGELVKKGRECNDLTQAEVSKKMGYSNAQYISNIERGEASLPIKDVKAMSKILHVPKGLFKEAIMKDFSDNYDRLAK